MTDQRQRYRRLSQGFFWLAIASWLYAAVVAFARQRWEFAALNVTLVAVMLLVQWCGDRFTELLTERLRKARADAESAELMRDAVKQAIKAGSIGFKFNDPADTVQ